MNDIDNTESAQAFQQEQEAIQYSFASEVWQTLSSVDVSNFTEKKGQFTYLSWAHAWATLMEFYPESTYKPCDNEFWKDESMSVGMKVTVRQGQNKLSRKMWLQVLDFKNKPIPNPSAHDVNNTRMRCLAKAVSMCGLGSYLYAGQDLPIAPEDRPKAQPRKDPDVLAKEIKAKMKEATTLGDLQTQFNGAKSVFKYDPGRMSDMIRVKDQLKEKFMNTQEKTA